MKTKNQKPRPHPRRAIHATARAALAAGAVLVYGLAGGTTLEQPKAQESSTRSSSEIHQSSEPGPAPAERGETEQCSEARLAAVWREIAIAAFTGDVAEKWTAPDRMLESYTERFCTDDAADQARNAATGGAGTDARPSRGTRNAEAEANTPPDYETASGIIIILTGIVLVGSGIARGIYRYLQGEA